MGRIAKDKSHLSTIIPANVSEMLTERAKSINMTKSAYAAAIIEGWAEKGMPPVNEIDRIVQVSRNRDRILAAAEDAAEYGKKRGK